MNGDNGGNSGDISGLVICHLVSQTDRLVPDFQDRGANRDDVTGMEFTVVLDVLLHSGHASSFLSETGPGQAHTGQQLPGRFVKLTRVPHNVYVIHVIALPGEYGSAIGDSELRHIHLLAIQTSVPNSSCAAALAVHSLITMNPSGLWLVMSLSDLPEDLRRRRQRIEVKLFQPFVQIEGLGFDDWLTRKSSQ